MTREQMATFLVRAFEYATGSEAPEAETSFTDISGTHAPNVRKLVQLGVTLGVTETEYAPTVDVRRGQMASFLARTLNRLAVQGIPPN